MSTSCQICQKKRGKRYCPGVHAEICSPCCGAERENTVDCPLDCEYLREARQHERPAPITDDMFPNKGVRINEDFLRQHEELVLWLANTLTRSMEQGKAVDLDAREALEALTKTYRTLESGLIYETRPQNPYAAGIQEAMKLAIEELRKKLAEKSGMQHNLRDVDVLGTLVFLQRLELQHNNGRRRGRAFFDFMRTYFPVMPAVVAAP